MFSLTYYPVFTSIRGSTSSLAHCPVSTPFGAQRFHWHTTQCLSLIPSPLLVDIVHFPSGLLLNVFRMQLLGRSFHTLGKNISFSSLTNVGSKSQFWWVDCYHRGIVTIVANAIDIHFMGP